MTSDLLQIGKSGTIAARSALDVTAQNIANANNGDYSRRSVSLSEVTAPGSIAYYSQSSMSGVRVDRITRSDSVFLQNQARLSSSDLARADAELSGLQSAERAIEQSGTYPAIVEFEAALAALEADPLDGALRAAVLETGRTLAQSLRISDGALAASGDQIRFEAAAQSDQVNSYTSEIARINSSLARSKAGTTSHAALLDQRDANLAHLAQQLGIAVSYEASGAVRVQLGDASGIDLVSGTQANTLAFGQNADGTASFTLNGSPVTPASGKLAGAAQSLAAHRDLGIQLDDLALQIITQVNDAQASGTAPDGSTGLPFFSGSNAGDIAIALSGGDGIAAAQAGSPAGSRDTANLTALRGALANGGPASAADQILYQLSSAISSRAITRDALSSISQSAQSSLAGETAVDLDSEAANLVRYQQAFQASGRVIQVASDIFDTILGIR